MSARFTQLRIAGFKSFADPVAVDILPGLTGIVGPNGCGKSNVVEALRWAMGETSARSLRGGEMDDLIFAGTTSRPARNLAEVTLVLENAKGLGPGTFAEQDDLEVARRAERGSGSDYRLNGKTTRGRDIQTLFADLASGARSSAMVSQGRVAMLVGARPEERRSILEEAAGITGLHARRHEAELKLRATENNLTRAEDLRTQLEARLEGLTGQSEQAAQYRTMSASLRDAEVTLLALLHARAQQQVERAKHTVHTTRLALKAAEESAETAVLGEYEADKALPAIREAAELARAALERQRVAAEGIAREEQRAAQVAEAATERLRQTEADRDAALSRLQDATASLARLKEELTATESTRAALPERQRETQSILAALQTALAETGEALERGMADAAAARTQAEQTRAAEEAARRHHAKLAQDHAALAEDVATLKASLPGESALEAAEAALRTAAARLAACRERMEAAQQRRSEAQVALSIARSAAETTRTRHREHETALAAATATLTALRRDREALAQRRIETEKSLVPEARRGDLALLLEKAEQERAAAAASLEAAEAERAAAAAALVVARGRVQEDTAIRNAAGEAVRTAEAALRRAEQEAQTFAREKDAAERNAVPDEVLEAAQNDRAQTETRLAAAESTLSAAEETAALTADAAREAETRLGALKAELTRLQAQIEGLSQALAEASGADEEAEEAKPPPVADALDIPDGLELACATALADGLDAPDAASAPDAPRSWHRLAPPETAPALPVGGQSLASLLASVPAVLARALSQAVLVASEAEGDALFANLLPGQCLVTREGAFWRWDGYRIAAGQPSAAAQRLAQRRVLRETRARFEAVSADLPQAERTAQAAGDARTEAAEAVRAARATRATVEAALGKLRTVEAETARRHAAARARLDAVRPQHDRATQALEAARSSLAEARTVQDALPAPESLRAAHDDARTRDQRATQAESAAREARRRAEAALEQARRAHQETEGRHAGAEARLATILPELARLEAEQAKAEESRAAADRALQDAADPEAAVASLKNAEAAITETDQAVTALRAETDTAAKTLTDAETAHRTMQEQALEIRSRLSATMPRLDALSGEKADAAQALETAIAIAATAAIDPGQPDAVEALREKLAIFRADEQAARETRAALTAEASSLAGREAALLTSLAEWTEREVAAQAHLADAEERLAAVSHEHRTVTALPAEARQLRDRTAAALAEAEEKALAASAAREAAEARLKETQESRRGTEGELAAAREALLRAEGKSEQAQAILAQLLAETPDPPTDPAGDLTEAAETGLRRKISRLTRERDELGPVNLRAEIEAREAEQQIEVIRREHAEIETAIARLRGSIGALNKEGRERLMAVFTQVDHHFQSLFARMFGGGRAHLGLVGSDDPLQAGLEIYAQPPGKKLATLSLLSGGEQALTALSLIFAVFRCNPAPICVLDEVDAPLDDANVGRFCALLGDMVNEAGTRFLVVTHHQLTMAHMDRLYGVTMQERGVSRVLSVDLERAAAMAGAAGKEETHV